ncbi:MAG: hypothetical protein V5A42_03870 [Halofilum sp. (in: g-proteobacteria)]
MNQDTSWLERPAVSASRALGEIAGFLPNLAAALVLGLLGWLVARFARVLVQRACSGLNRLIERMPARASALFGVTPTTARVLGDFAFWVVVFLFLVGIAAALRLDAVSEWLARLAGFLPALLAGGLIIVIGIAGSILLGQLTSATVAPLGGARGQLLGRGVQASVLTMAIVLGVGQMGLDTTLPVALIVVVTASVGGALTLAFALGAVDVVRNLVGAQGLQQHCQLHQRVRIGEIEGEVTELTATSVVLSTGEGRVIVPARAFHEQPVTLLAPTDDD